MVRAQIAREELHRGQTTEGAFIIIIILLLLSQQWYKVIEEADGTRFAFWKISSTFRGDGEERELSQKSC